MNRMVAGITSLAQQMLSVALDPERYRSAN